MRPPFGHQPVLTLLLALIPPAVSWWIGRRVRSRGDDPALPELLFERSQLIAKLFVVVVTVMILLTGRDAIWGIPLLVVLLIFAGYPVRRGVLGETWGFAAYVWHTARSLVGSLGLWFAVCLAPLMVYQLGRERWWAALLLIPILLAWEQWNPRLWLRTHDARPLERPDLLPRFHAIVRASGRPVPEVYQVGAPGSRFVNAMALPSVRRPAVVMGNALLELLEPDEIVAIFAHEVAHFDQYTPPAVRRIQLMNRSLIIGGIALTLAALFAAPAVARWIALLWPLAVVLAAGQRAAKSQKHETESDLRAVALCGDPEAMVRGLVKLHLHARIPRRWAIDFERAATHPSLARRIQAIRASAASGGTTGTGTEMLGAPTVVRSTRAGAAIILDDSRGYWLDGVPADADLDPAALRERASSYRAVNYPDLIELRVAAAGNDRVLRARGRQGEVWSVPIAAQDVERVQRALDVIDVRLGQGRVPSPAMAPKAIAMILLAAAIVSAQTGIVLVPIALTLWRPSTAALAALGAVAVARAALGALDDGYWWSETVVWAGLAVMAVGGVAALYTAWRRMRIEESGQGFTSTLVAMGGVTVLVAASLVVQAAVAPLAAIVGAPLVGTLGVALLGTIAPLFTLRRPSVRRAAFGGVVLASLVATLSVDWRVLSRRPSIAESKGRAVLVADADLGRAGSGLRLSPSGTRFLITRMPAMRRPTSPGRASLSVGTFGGGLRDLDGIAGDFVDDEHVLVLEVLDDGMQLRLERADSAVAPSWVDTIPGLVEARLQVDRGARTWIVIGDDIDADEPAVFVGRVGHTGSLRRLSLPDTISMIGDPIVLAGGESALVPVVFSPSPATARVGMFPLPLAGLDPMRGELWRIGGGDARRVSSMRGFPQCGDPENGAAACLARHFRTTTLWVVGADGEVAEAGALPISGFGTNSIGPGWHVAAFSGAREAVIIDLAARRLTRVALPDSLGHATELRATAGHLATVTQGANGRSSVRLYRVDGVGNRD